MTTDPTADRAASRLRVAAARARGSARAGVHGAVLRARSAWHRADPVLDTVDPDRRRCFPRHPDDLAHYRDRFAASASLFDRFVEHAAPVRLDPGAKTIAVAVIPWFATPAPWYAVALGLGLARSGREVVFVGHDLLFPEATTPPSREVTEIRRILKRLDRQFPVVRLSTVEAAAAPEPGDADLVDRLTDANVLWGLRGTASPERYPDFADRIRAHLTDALPRVRTVMRSHDLHAAVVPGGIVGPSGLYLEAGREAGVRVATFDGGLGWTEVNPDGVAAQQTDTPRAFALLEREPAAVHDEVVALARAEFEGRRSGADRTAYQHAEPGELPDGARGSVVIPMSVVFDTSALGRHHLFADSRAWLVETIRAVLRETGDPVFVRQHPSERKATERSAFDVHRILADEFAGDDQVRLIAADDPVNTYDLLEACRLVLPFVSTIGIEAAALGKPVVVAGDVYYAQLGFVWSSDTRDEYFDLLARGARGELPLLPDQADRAWRAYYLNAVCHRVFTDFTPQPPDFWRWVDRPPDELYGDPDVTDILTAIDEDVPLSILRHTRRLRSTTQPQ